MAIALELLSDERLTGKLKAIAAGPMPALHSEPPLEDVLLNPSFSYDHFRQIAKLPE